MNKARGHAVLLWRAQGGDEGGKEGCKKHDSHADADQSGGSRVGIKIRGAISGAKTAHPSC